MGSNRTQADYWGPKGRKEYYEVKYDPGIVLKTNKTQAAFWVK